ncbi:PMT-domain-containing protein, partial [Caulochytrium protostelioides]
MVLLVLTILTRLWRIEHPGQVVFDEVHFGKFAAYYLQRTYFFDVHPPLAKMLFALAGWFVGFDGKFLFDNIGDDYVANNVPYIGLRLFSAAFGIAIVPLAFTIMRDIGLSAPTAFMGGLMLVLDNALVTQSQLILLDTQLLFFGMLSAYCYVQFFKHRSVPLTRVWWTWNLATGASLACVLGVKLVGFIPVATVGMAVAFDLWRLLDIRRGLTVREFTRHFAARALGLIFFPIAIYMLFFVAHFQILRYSGPGDDFMSLPFQSTLEGNKITTASTRVPFPSVVTLHARTHDVFLHSHLDRYPLRYDDGRVSSAGQQVSGYPHVDVNNLWSLDEPDPAR